jgi:hypothetical protein
VGHSAEVELVDAGTFLHKLFKATGWRPPSQVRQETQVRAEAARAAARDLDAEPSHELAEWCHRQGVEYPFSASGDWYEDARSYVETLESFLDDQAKVVAACEARLALVADDAARSGHARRALYKQREIFDFADHELSVLWPKVKRPVVNGPKDWLNDLSDLACKCGCGRLFKSTRERKATFGGVHPLCVEERRQAAVAKPATYAEELAAELPL